MLRITDDKATREWLFIAAAKIHIYEINKETFCVNLLLFFQI